MMTLKGLPFMIVVFTFLLPLLLPGEALQQSQEAQEERIIERVEVTNVAVTVRVFDKGKPVKGLKKKDFKLFENDKEKEIRVFFETRKKVTETNEASQSSAGKYVKRPSRLFLLNFNIGDHRIDIKGAVKPFFKKILQPGDRLIVISNSFFLNDRVVIDPEVERKKVEHILDVEKVKAHWRFSWMDYEVGNAIKGYADIRSASANDQEPNTAAAWEFFREEYLKFLLDYKATITMMDEEKFLKLFYR